MDGKKADEHPFQCDRCGKEVHRLHYIARLLLCDYCLDKAAVIDLPDCPAPTGGVWDTMKELKK